MSQKAKFIVSFILFIVSLTFIACGILLFNFVPEVDTAGYTNPKDALMMTGVFFSFVFALAGLCGSVGFLIYGFTKD